MTGPVIRSSNLQFFLARADAARAEGDAATLDHVRERCRRSEAAWTELANKAQRSERLREEEAARKAARDLPTGETSAVGTPIDEPAFRGPS